MKVSSPKMICAAYLMALSISVFGQTVRTDFDHQADFSQYKTYSWQTIQAANSLWDARIKNAIDAQLASKGWTEGDDGTVNTSPAAEGSTRRDNDPKLAPPPSAPAGSNSGDSGPFPPPPPAPTGSNQGDNRLQFPPPPSGDSGPFPPRSPSAAAPETTSPCRTSAPCVVIVTIQTTETQRSLRGFYSGFGGGFGWQGFGDGQINITEQDYQQGTLVVDMYDAKTRKLLWRGSAEGTLSDKAEKNEKKLDKAVAKMFKDFPPSPTKR